MIRLIISLAASTVLAGCAMSTVMPTAPSNAATARGRPPAIAKPHYGTFGFDSTGMDPSLAPGNDFFGYANGAWVAKTPIPSDKGAYGMFNVLDDLSRTRTRVILEEQATDPNSKIGRAYQSFMDTASIEAKGLNPLGAWLNEVRAVSKKADLANLYGQAAALSISGPFQSFVVQDDKAPERYALQIGQGGLGMPDRDYYLSRDPKLLETKSKYLRHVANVLDLAGERDTIVRARAILDLETAIAKVHWTRAESRDPDKRYNRLRLAELGRRAPGFDFGKLLRGLGANVNVVLVAQPSALTGEAATIARAPLSVLKDQLLVRSIDAYAAYLPQAFDEERFSFYGTVLSGTPQQEPRWKRAVKFTIDTLGDDVSKLYVAKYFPPETKAAADELVRNVIAAMGRRINRLDWMSQPTKAKAQTKLATFTPKIGYPSQWRDMSGLQIDRNDLVGNAMRSSKFELAYELSKLAGPVRHWEWGLTPMTINAYADFGLVEIVFPAAILQPPFFDPHADPAVNYGGIGAVIGHELSHHFDDEGARYDSTGKLVDWWTAADIKAFTSRLDKLEQQIDGYEPLPGMHVNGKLTMGENVADLAGLTVAHDAYIASLGGKEPPVIDGVTGDQRFYLGWAQVWRCKAREETLRKLLLTNPHSPCPVRAAVVRNMDPWYSAFRVLPGQALYLDPASRVRIW